MLTTFESLGRKRKRSARPSALMSLGKVSRRSLAPCTHRQAAEVAGGHTARSTRSKGERMRRVIKVYGNNAGGESNERKRNVLLHSPPSAPPPPPPASEAVSLPAPPSLPRRRRIDRPPETQLPVTATSQGAGALDDRQQPHVSPCACGRSAARSRSRRHVFPRDPLTRSRESERTRPPPPPGGAAV